jgi:hypothetical protein
MIFVQRKMSMLGRYLRDISTIFRKEESLVSFDLRVRPLTNVANEVEPTELIGRSVQLLCLGFRKVTPESKRI